MGNLSNSLEEKKKQVGERDGRSEQKGRGRVPVGLMGFTAQGRKARHRKGREGPLFQTRRKKKNFKGDNPEKIQCEEKLREALILTYNRVFCQDFP